MPTWSDADQTLAERCRTGSQETRLSALTLPRCCGVTDDRSSGSSGIGDISWNVPPVTLTIRPTSGCPGQQLANAVAIATPIAHKDHRRRQGPGDDHARC